MMARTPSLVAASLVLGCVVAPARGGELLPSAVENGASNPQQRFGLPGGGETFAERYWDWSMTRLAPPPRVEHFLSLEAASTPFWLEVSALEAKEALGLRPPRDFWADRDESLPAPRLAPLRAEGDGWSLTLKGGLPAGSRDLPDAAAANAWWMEETVKVRLVGPLTLFGQFDSAPGPDTAQHDVAVNGKTGLECQLPAPVGLEVQLRGGHALSYSGPLRLERRLETVQPFVEVQARCKLLGPVGLEYQGAALPALGTVQRDQIRQEVRLAVPVGATGKLRLGATHQWEATPATDTRPWTESMELFLGLELGK
jgi:hypothetical protein